MNYEVLARFLDYGLPGFCVVMMIFLYRVVAAEQRRPGAPRKGVIRLCSLIMVFAIVLVAANVVFQRQEEKTLSARIAEIDARHDQITAKLEDDLAAKAKEIVELNSRLEQKAVTGADELNSLRRELDSTASLSLAKLKEEHKSETISARAEIERLRSTLSVRDHAISSAEHRAAEQANELAVAQSTLRNIAQKLSPLRTMSKDEPTESIVTMAAVTIGVASDIRVYMDAHPGLVRDVAVLDAANGKLTEVQLKAKQTTQSPYAVSTEIPIGQMFVDSASGVSLSISDTNWTMLGTRFFGNVTFPDGKSERISAVESGSSWPFTWNHRRYVIAIAAGSKSGTYRVSLQETTALADR